MRKDTADLKTANDAHARDRGRIESRRIGTGNRNASRSRGDEAGKHTEQRTLARAIGSDDGMHRSLAHGEVQSVERAESRKRFHDVVRAYARRKGYCHRILHKHGGITCGNTPEMVYPQAYMPARLKCGGICVRLEG